MIKPGNQSKPSTPPRKHTSATSEPTPERERSQRPRTRPEAPPRRRADPNEVESPRLHVGNLSYDTNEQDLIDLFKGVGSVQDAEVVAHSRTHRSKGFAFVTMNTIDEARRAVEVLDNQPFMGRKLSVSGAKSQGRNDWDDDRDSDSDSDRDSSPSDYSDSDRDDDDEPSPRDDRS